MFDPNKVTLFAETDARGKRTPFGIKAKDRQRHVYVIGKTGMGKSTMLENMAIQDIQSGEGIAFIDPHGSTAEKLLDFVPEHRKNDVLYFAPHDLEFPVSFNIMEDVGADKRHLVVSGLMSVFEKIWVDAWSARMAYILQNTLMALLEYPDSTLMSVNRVLSDKDYRTRVVDNVTDPAVKSFWVDEFAKYTDRFAAEATPAIQNKIGQFTSNPVIRNIIGQPDSSFDIRKIMDEKKILIMNLSKGLIGESNANLLGSMLTTRIYLAAMSRADLSPRQMEQMPNFYFYVDEFQSFANSTFSNILSEARKYKLNLTIAHQYIEQMEEEVKSAVFGNVGTTITFRVGPFDAEVLETIFAPQFNATDIVNLGFAQIYLTLMIDGIGSQPFSAVTLPPINPPTVSYKEMVIAASRQQFANKRSMVEASVAKFHEPIVPPKTEQRESKNKPQSERRDNGSGAAKKRAPDDGRGRGSGSERGGDRGREQKRQSGESQRQPADAERRPPKQKEKNLDELRETLRSIAGNGNGDKKQVPEKTDARLGAHMPDDAVRTTKGKDERADLKSALAGVLKDGETKRAADPGTQPPAQTHTEASSPQESSSVAPPAQPPAASRAAHESNDRISPKELERMMRITTSDRPPPH